MYSTTHGMKSAMLARRVIALDAMKTKARVLCIRAAPTIKTARMASTREKTPRMKPRACGMGPLKLTESQAMMEERRTVEQSRKMTDSMQAMITTGNGIFPIFTRWLRAPFAE